MTVTEAAPPPPPPQDSLLHNLLEFGCCAEFLRTRNRVLPSLPAQAARTAQSDYVELGPGRRLRVVARRPEEVASVQVDTKQEEVAEDGENEDEEEEYWFENAAPNRLPVIQPAPQPPTSRIINKFEPREASQTGTPKSRPDDLISPGRLPRKNLKAAVVELEADDYEDGEEVSTELGPAPAPPRVPPSAALTAGLGSMQQMILEITAEGTDGRKSPVGGNAAVSSPPASPGRDPAEDSCHPSPEIPHRAVCPLPDPPDTAQPDSADSGPGLVVSGGCLGGVANQGFAAEEEEEEKPTETTNPVLVELTETDCGYSRDRDIGAAVEAALACEASPGPASPEPGPGEPPQPLQPILFFLHGLGGSADMWSSQLNYFVAQGYEVSSTVVLRTAAVNL